MSDFGARSKRPGQGGDSAGSAVQRTPGKRSLVEARLGVQRRRAAPDPAASTEQVRASAEAGTAGPGGALPHAERIQAAFGHHDVSGVQAHVGGAATAASEAMGAEAFATGDHVGFRGPPDLHTAAHEAAHVVQQRAGVALKGGVGEDGDPYEQHADAVADAVVTGGSAEGLLDQMAPGGGGGGGGGGGVQRKLIVGGQEYTDADEIRDAAFEAAGATATSIEGLVHVGTDDEVIARFPDWEAANAQYDHAPIGDPLAHAHDPEDRVEIPALIHFIWMGKPPTEAAVQNILTWAARAQNTAWRIILWTDETISTGNWGPQLERLHGHVELRQILPVLDDRLQRHYLEATRNGPRAFNMASDMARYSILQQFGGVYADVDLGPGTVDLTQVPRLSISDIPVTSPQVRDRQALQEQLQPEELESLELQDQVRVAAQRAYRNNQLNNNLMVSGPNSAYMDRLIGNVDQQMTRRQDSRESWAENAALITGPQAVITTMFQHLDGADGGLTDNMEQETLGNWSQLDWLTQESENQTYDTSSSGKDGPSKKGDGPSKKKGGCFLTTACVEARGLPDDCHELTTLRAFRDGYLRGLPEGEALIQEYYDLAPGIVAALRRDPRFHERALELYDRLVIGSIRLIEAGRERAALEHYRSIVQELSRLT